MRLGIDASNIRTGGGITHLVEFLKAAEPPKHGFDEVIIYGSASTLRRVGEYKWMRKDHQQLLDKSLQMRLFWQLMFSKNQAELDRCNVLFVPGGTYLGRFKPFVTMSRNMLPFSWREIKRYGISWMLIKLCLLRYAQLSTFKRADGVIFLTRYALANISRYWKKKGPRTTLVPHGIEMRFRSEPKIQRALSYFSESSPFRLLYVSPIAPYKNQLEVIEAIRRLRKDGMPLSLYLVGPITIKKNSLFTGLSILDEENKWLRYLGEVPFERIHLIYRNSDAFIFASSCENMPNILLEAMASGLPIACSDQGPMPEILEDAGYYFDPRQPTKIVAALNAMVSDPTTREQKAWASYQRSLSFTWERCADETLGFISSASCASFREQNSE